MRQVTGSNHTTTVNKESIQLPLDGLLFIGGSVPACNEAEDTIVEVELLTSKSIIVPSECFEPTLADSLLQLSGLGCTDAEQPVWSNDSDGVVAVMAIRKEIVAELDARFGDRLQYTSPLLRSVKACDGLYLYIYNAAGVAYFKLYDGAKLRFCEAMSVVGNDDILCIVERLVQEFDCKGLEIGVAGENSDNLVGLLKQYHKVKICD